MSPFEIASLILATTTAILIPIVILLVRGTSKWTRVETKLDNVVAELKSIVENKDKVHAEMLGQMRDDRAATDRRLRWLEEYLWKRGSSAS